MNNEIKNKILDILNNSSTFKEFKKKINNLYFSEKQDLKELEVLRKNTKDIKEYQKLTYQINKQNKADTFFIEIYGQKREVISAKTFYINLLKYSKIPSNEFLPFYKKFIVFISNKTECDCCTLDSIISFLANSCNNYYSEERIDEMLDENNFDIFITPADFMREIEVSSTKSLNIRINKYNETSINKIVPFKFNVKEKTKILYLKKDMIKLKKALL